jgi:putative PIN family toxin of toxin-antitoxin system
MISAVLDVNVLVSSLLGPLGFSRRIVVAWQAEAFRLLTSEGIIAEVGEKLRLPRIARRFHLIDDDRHAILRLLTTQAEIILVPPAECLPVTGDPEDDYVLAAARLGKAEYLVTGDRELLERGEYAGVKIITPRAFVAILEGNDSGG